MGITNITIENPVSYYLETFRKLVKASSARKSFLMKNKFSLGIPDNEIKSRVFWLKDFNENLAQGYIKLVQIENGLEIQVIDTYNLGSKEDEEKYINSGYIKVSYPPK